MWFVHECVRAVRAYCSKCEICTRKNLMNSHSMNEWIDGWLSSNQSKKWKRWRRESIVRGSGHTIELYIYILSRHLYGSIAVYSPVLFVDGVVVAACSLVLFTPNHLPSVKGTASIPYESYNTRSRTEFRVYFLPWGTKLFSFRLPLFSFFLSPHFLSSYPSLLILFFQHAFFANTVFASHATQMLVHWIRAFMRLVFPPSHFDFDCFYPFYSPVLSCYAPGLIYKLLLLLPSMLSLLFGC